MVIKKILNLLGISIFDLRSVNLITTFNFPSIIDQRNSKKKKRRRKSVISWSVSAGNETEFFLTDLIMLEYYYFTPILLLCERLCTNFLLSAFTFLLQPIKWDQTLETSNLSSLFNAKGLSAPCKSNNIPCSIYIDTLKRIAKKSSAFAAGILHIPFYFPRLFWLLQWNFLHKGNFFLGLQLIHPLFFFFFWFNGICCMCNISCSLNS